MKFSVKETADLFLFNKEILIGKLENIFCEVMPVIVFYRKIIYWIKMNLLINDSVILNCDSFSFLWLHS